MRNGSVMFGLLAALSVSIFLLVIFDIVGPAGWQINQADMTGDYVSGVMWALILGLGILLWPVSAADKRGLLVAWIARCVVTLVIMLAYEKYQGLDSFWYFDNSTNSLPGEWAKFKMGDGTTNIMKLARWHAYVFPNSFHLMKVNFSMIGFLATYLFYRSAIKFLKREDIRVFFVLALFPSMIFWSSTLGKDPITMLGVALYAYGVSAWYETKLGRYVVIMLFGIWMALAMRSWLGPILLAPVGVFGLSRMRSLLSKLVFIGTIAGAFVYAGGRFQEQFRIETSADLVATIEGRAHSTGWAGNTARVSERRFTNVAELLSFLPLGAFTALFRPLPGEFFSVFGFLAGLENLVLLMLLFRAIKRTRLPDLWDPRLMWALALILTWSSIYGFISYQNLGAASRFRLQILPILLCTLLYLARDRSVESTLVPK